MKLLIGSDVLVDAVMSRKPYVSAIRRLFIAAAFGDVRLETALRATDSTEADYLITRDKALAARSPLPTMSAGGFLALLLREHGVVYEEIDF